MIQVYSIKMSREFSDEERQYALDNLTPERKAKALRFRRFKDQNRSILAGLIEDYAIRKHLGVDCIDYAIEKGKEGKPYLAGYEDVFYNISHAGDFVVCAIGNEPIGVDVEQSNKYSERVVKRFFQVNEIEDILSQEEGCREDVFADYWVMKESFMKLSGAGFSVPLRSFYTNRKNGEIMLGDTIPDAWVQELIRLGMTDVKKPVCQFLSLETGYSCAICTLGLAEYEYHNVDFEMIKSIHRQNG